MLPAVTTQEDEQMSDPVKVRVGFQGARELELDVDDGDAVAEAVEKQLEKGGIAWILDTDGDRHGLVVEKITFLEVQGEERSGGVGFSAPA